MLTSYSNYESERSRFQVLVHAFAYIPVAPFWSESRLAVLPCYEGHPSVSLGHSVGPNTDPRRAVERSYLKSVEAVSMSDGALAPLTGAPVHLPPSN